MVGACAVARVDMGGVAEGVGGAADFWGISRRRVLKVAVTAAPRPQRLNTPKVIRPRMGTI